MNEPSQTPTVPPVMAAGGLDPQQPDLPLGQIESDRLPIASLVMAVETVLRDPRRVLFQLTQPQQGRLRRDFMAITLISACIYGLVVGTFSGGQQLLAAPVKIAAGLILSAVIC